jgi:hypothetical protein
MVHREVQVQVELQELVVHQVQVVHQEVLVQVVQVELQGLVVHQEVRD